MSESKLDILIEQNKQIMEIQHELLDVLCAITQNQYVTATGEGQMRVKKITKEEDNAPATENA